MYDNSNRLQSKQTPFGNLSYTYDAAGNELTINSSNAGGISDTHIYDELNRLSTVTDGRVAHPLKQLVLFAPIRKRPK